MREITISRYFGFSRSLGKWVAASPRIWRVFYNEGKNCIEALSDTVGLV